MPIDFPARPIWFVVAVFAASAAVVWIAGTRIAHYADRIAARTGLGHALVGLVLLGGITSLPEVAVTVSSAAAGNAALAVNNILGSLAINVAILALADVAFGRDALTSAIPDPIVLLQGTLNVILLSLLAAAVTVGDFGMLGIGVWVWAILLFYLGALWMLARARGRFPWRPAGPEPQQHPDEDGLQAPPDASAAPADDEPFARVLPKTAAAGAAILAAGYFLSRTGEDLAGRTGLGTSFFGAAFVGLSTSLPEISTVLAAVRIRQYLLAVSDIFGTNLFNVGMLFLVDGVYRGGPVLNEVGRFSAFASLLGIILTALYLAGLVERRDRTVLRMGYDSLAVAVLFAAGLSLLYRLR